MSEEKKEEKIIIEVTLPTAETIAEDMKKLYPGIRAEIQQKEVEEESPAEAEAPQGTEE